MKNRFPLFSEGMDNASVRNRIVEHHLGDIEECFANPDKEERDLGEVKKTLADMCRDAWKWQQENSKEY